LPAAPTDARAASGGLMNTDDLGLALYRARFFSGIQRFPVNTLCALCAEPSLVTMQICLHPDRDIPIFVSMAALLNARPALGRP
jgi:hypothetical protein